MKLIKLFILVAFLTAGCATATPKELINARAAYQHASQGPAAQLAPAELHKAHVALGVAEKSFKAEPESYKTRDLSYVAQRKSELAGTLGMMAYDKASKKDANDAYAKTQSRIVEQGKQDLLDSKAREAQTRRDAADNAREDKVDADKRIAASLAASAADKAKQDLQASEERTAAALAKLAKLAAVKEDERGLVVTLSGSVLFRSNESYLLPAAKIKLDEVSKALMAVKERNLIVEGHTDSIGKASYNQDLSQRRADTVRDYLIHAGYPNDRIQARGMGQGSPVGDNASAEGRANNRRVEIIIERKSHATN